MRIIKAQGWGVCVPQNYDKPGSTSVLLEKQERINRLRAVYDLLAPDWWHNWTVGVHDGFDDKFLPVLYSSADIGNPAAINALRGRSWIMLNEPENPAQSHQDPQSALSHILEQVRRFLGMGLDFEFIMITPNVNITNHEWVWNYLDPIARGCRRHGVFIHLGIHCYVDRPDWLEKVWRDFMQWYDSLQWPGLDVVFTECGVPPDRPPEVALEMLPHFRRLMTPPVLGMAWFTAFDSYNPEGMYHGLLQKCDDGYKLSEIGNLWLEMR